MATNSGEFQEVYLTGATIEFKGDPRGGVSFRLHERSEFPAAFFWVCVSYEGAVLDTIPAFGMGSAPVYPKPSIPAPVLSDRQGMFGRRCPHCTSYFRTDACADPLTCPYCGHVAKTVQFMTDNQLEFIGAVCNAFLEVSRKGGSVVLDLSKVAEQLPDNRPKWHYAEEQQQNSYTCPKCSAKYDVLGEYAACPSCRTLNLRHVFGAKMMAFAQKLNLVAQDVSDRHDREEEWARLTECISEFEGLANEARKQLLRLPATPRRKRDLGQLSFQNIVSADRYLQAWYGFEILEGMSCDDKVFLTRMFNRRHLFVHKAGRVDQEYLDKTQDTSVRLNEVIRFRSKEIRRLIPLVKGCGERLTCGLESIR